MQMMFICPLLNFCYYLTHHFTPSDQSRAHAAMKN